MLLTNWGDPAFLQSEETTISNDNQLQYGIKIAMWVLSFLIYASSQLAGLICPDNFSVDEL